MAKFKDPFKPVARPKATPKGYAGYDNARENIDPKIKTQTISSQQGTIQQTPINDYDIVNKKYVDDNFSNYPLLTGVDNSVLILDSDGIIKTDEINNAVWGSTLVTGSGSSTRVAVWSGSTTLTSDGDLVWTATDRLGINTTNPGYNCDITGTLRSTSITHFGGSSHYVSTSSNGILTFNGSSSGIPCGSFYGNSVNWVQLCAVNAWYNIVDSTITTGRELQVSHDGNGKLTIETYGYYLCNYNISFECNTKGAIIESGLEIGGSGSANAAGQATISTNPTTSLFNLSGTAILPLEERNNYIELCIRTTTAGTPTITVDKVNLTILHITGL